MTGIFEGQFDYIYFLYGLSFFLFGIICFSTGRGKFRKIPWEWLGLFGVAHGFSEWMEMCQIIYGRSQLLSVSSLVLHGVSFLFLLEFARVGLFRLKGIRIAHWAYLPILLLLPLIHPSGINGWNILLRYSLGFPGAYAASRMLYEFYRKEHKDNSSLVFLSAMLALYAVLTGLVTPKADFFPARLINNESFYRTLGLPVQLLRGVVALCAAMAAWLHSTTMPGITFRPKQYFIRLVPTKRLVAVTVIVLVTAGWVFTNYFDYYAGIKIIKSSKQGTDTSLNRLIRELTLLSRITASLSKVASIRQAVSGGVVSEAEKVRRTLALYRERSRAEEALFFDKDGMLLFSAQPQGEPGFDMSKSQARKPYFRDALRGDNGYYFELGPRYNERKYYVSYPVMDKENRVAGVVVLVKNIQAAPILHYRLLGILITFFVCLLAVVFLITLRRRETLLKAIEQAHANLLTVDEMKSDFVSIVSHELRTPLTSIRNAASILLRGGPARRQVEEGERELLQIILSNVDRQARMVSDLLDISKIEENLIPINYERTDIVALVRSAAVSLQPQIDEKQLQLSVSSSVPAKTVSIDPEHTHRIIDNLIVNAVKFTPPGGRIDVRVEDEGAQARVTVSDTGIGISAQDKEKLFSKFFRSTDARVAQEKGWGLGLAITKSLVEAQGGVIRVESEPGKGSAFSFTVLTERKNDREEQDAGRG